MSAYTLLQRACWSIPNVDMELSPEDISFLAHCGIVPDVAAAWHPEVTCH